MIQGWTPHIGDPSFMGWFTVICYFFSSGVCFRALGSDPGAANLWRVLGLMLAVLGINKQLDLQTLLTQIGRDFARAEDWYDRRREVQRLFVGIVGVVAVLAAVVVAWIFRNQSRPRRIAVVGFTALAAFICIRAASFHHVDALLGLTLFGARFNWIIELGGIGAVTFGAASACWQRRVERRHPEKYGRY